MSVYSANIDQYDNDSRLNSDQVSIAKFLKEKRKDNEYREITRCRNCNGSITITKICYENKKVYLEITCPCSVVENYEIQKFEDNYIFKEEINTDPQKIPTSDLFCACDNKKKNEYYCVDSQKNLCNECIGKQRDHINHTIIVFFDESIKRIIDNIKGVILDDYKEENDINRDKENSDNNSSNNDKIIENELTKKQESLEGDELDNFNDIIALLKKLIEQYNKNPYYNLYQTIKNLYDFCSKMGEEKKISNEESNKEKEVITKKRIRYKREFKDLKEDDNIISINIITNNFYDLSILKKCSYKNFQFLEILRLQENNIDDIKVLSEIEFPNLRELNLSKNRLNDNCIEHLKNFKIKKCIKELNVYDNNIKNPEFFSIMKDFKQLEVLFVGHNKFENRFDAESYEFPDTLKKVGLTIGVFSNESIEAIKKFKFKNLETLYLKGNGFKNLEFIKDLQCDKLENIWLRNNLIEDYRPLERFKETIKVINLRGNLISNIKGLDEFLKQFKVLNEFVLSDNKIDLTNTDNSKIIEKIIKLNSKKKFILKYT